MVSIVGSLGLIGSQTTIWMIKNDFSTTIAAGARSALTNIVNVGPFIKIYIVGIAISSEANTNWRVKFYSKDTGIGATYDLDTYLGDVEIASLSATAGTFYEGSVECAIPYWDYDGTYEIHMILENIGSVTSKALVTILYSEA